MCPPDSTTSPTDLIHPTASPTHLIHPTASPTDLIHPYVQKHAACALQIRQHHLQI